MTQAQSSAHETGVQVPHRVDPEVSPEEALWRPAP